MPVAEVARFAAQRSGERAELEAASGRLREEDSAYVDALRLLAGQPTLVLPRNASQRDRGTVLTARPAVVPPSEGRPHAGWDRYPSGGALAGALPGEAAGLPTR
jgi:hypothetical protein